MDHLICKPSSYPFSPNITGKLRAPSGFKSWLYWLVVWSGGNTSTHLRGLR